MAGAHVLQRKLIRAGSVNYGSDVGA
jgi:hypothetical protein